MPGNPAWCWPLHPNSNISYIFMEKNCLNRKRGHAIIGFNHGLPCYVKNMALGPQLRQKPRPTASFLVYLSPSGHVFNIAWQAMIKTYNIEICYNHIFPKTIDPPSLSLYIYTYQGYGQVKYLCLVFDAKYMYRVLGTVLTCTWHFEIQK